MFQLLAETQQANPLAAFLPLILIVGVGYFLMIRPQQRKMRAQRELLNQLEVGDEVVTAAGIFGSIIDIDDNDDVLTVEIAPGTNVRMLRGGISRRLSDEDETPDDGPGDGPDGYEDDDEAEEADRSS
jgi:preprotein translocase subunit YajC